VARPNPGKGWTAGPLLDRKTGVNVEREDPMHKRIRACLLGTAALGVGLALARPLRADDEAGKKAFLAQECNKCHAMEKFQIEATVTSEKMKGPDLSKVGDHRDAAWITKFVNKEVDIEGKKHKNEYKGTKKDLETIVNWLAGLKS
jgi:hypothetical protein